jgi:hypothetical protein
MSDIKLQVTINADRIKFSDPKNPRNTCEVSFERTLKIPDDDKIYPLPPSLGKFPIRKVVV